MAIQNRIGLKSQFTTGSIPTATNFGNLIDSLLNKRDDKFHGLWRPGIEYLVGDVVLWGKTMYMLVNTTKGIEQQKFASKSGTVSQPQDTNELTPYCSKTCPPDDKAHWCQLEFSFEDKDWVIDENGHFIYANPEFAQKVGIGINQSTVSNAPLQSPTAKLHIYEEKRGEFKFNPDGQTRAEFRMEAFNPPDCDPGGYYSVYLDTDYLHEETNAGKGFSFDYINPDIQTIVPQTPTQLMVVHGDHGNPEVGIGTNSPSAMLDVFEEGKREFLVNPSDSGDPELRLTNLNTDQNEACLVATVHADFADLSTNAENGFRFKPKDAPIAAKNALPGDDVVVISANGKIGIGIEVPTARIHASNPGNGEFQACLDQPNPSIALINLEATPDKSAVFALGVDENNAILQTDAGCGFVFRSAAEPGLNAKPDINEGDDMVFIDKNGNTGICKSPLGYQLDVNGTVRQYENYLPMNKVTMDKQRKLEPSEALDIICGLNPVRFAWKNNLDGKLKAGDHFGLKESEVEDVVSEIFKQVAVGSSKEKAINMTELIPVLIAAMKRQQEMIQDLHHRLLKIETK